MTDKPDYLAGIEKRRDQYRNMKTLIDSLPEDLQQLHVPTMKQRGLYYGALAAITEIEASKRGGMIISGSPGLCS